MADREVRSFCRFCTACCGTVLTVDAQDRIVRVRGDRDDLMTEGYACLKGLEAPAALYGPDRIMTPLKRRPDGSYNSTGRTIPAVKQRMPYNPPYMNPQDLSALGLCAGAAITLTSDAGSIPAIVEIDAGVRRGVVSMSHGFGGMPWESIYELEGASTGTLISTDRDLDPINAMPRMSAIPVRITTR